MATDGVGVVVRRRVSSRWLLVALGLLSATSMLATAGCPVLLRWPLLLVGLSPRAPFLAAASSSPLLAFLAVGTARLVLADPIHFALGRRHGADRLGRRTQAFVARLGLVAVVLRPNGPVLALAGATGMRLRWVALADGAGTVGYLLLLRYGVRTILG